MPREIVEHEAYLVQVHSDHRITTHYQGSYGTARFLLASSRFDGYSRGLGYIGLDPLFVLDHGQYTLVNDTCNTNWRASQKGEPEVPLIPLIEGE